MPSTASQRSAASQVRRHIQKHFANDWPQHESLATNYYWERKRRLVLELIAVHKDEVVDQIVSQGRNVTFVDIGCGDGVDLAMIADFLASPDASAPQWKCIGIDGFPPSIGKFKERMAKRGLNAVEFRLGNIERTLPLNDAEVDILYCSEVMEHIPDSGPILEEFHRVLRSGGLMLMTTPNEPNVFQRSYWSRSHYAKLYAQAPRVVHPNIEINGELVQMYSHVTLRLAHQWDEVFALHGFDCIDYRRGAAVYGGWPIFKWTVVRYLRLACEWLLDLLPLRFSRELSDQVIALYRKRN